ncbi:hypothetical protein TNCV_3939591 [Trichonephila clavipes]|uniref:Uncharacterized protein n=1 Tax=Trichonephila clavipes TaxID=2585209 RepID=A0A8X6VVK0_TRICX|nr:hypothetical protein TNCV_3939591 [Trichonephila clavipes]
MSEFQLFSYPRAFGDEPRNFESWSSDETTPELSHPSPNYHTNRRTFELSTDFTCFAPLRCGSSTILDSNS